MTKTLIISNNVQEENLDTITNFFEKYQLGKPLSINYNNESKSAILELEFWYDNVCANNMYHRIVESGEARIVYNEPDYFSVRFYHDEKESVDYRDEYLANENLIYDNPTYYEDTVDCRHDYIVNENRVKTECQDDNKVFDDNKVMESENSYYGESNDSEQSDNEESDNDAEYLEDDVIENANNIEMLFDIVKEMSKKMKTIEKRIGNISKKTTVLYKERPHVIKRSIWEGRLRSR